MAKAYGETAARQALANLAAPVATIAALKTIAAEDRYNGMLVQVTAAGYLGGGMWRYLLAGALTGDDQVIVTPTVGSGTWVRMTGGCELAFAIAFGTADAAILWTAPTGCKFVVHDLAWRVTTSWTGGTNSAIGLSSSTKTTPTDWSTKGDLLGGASGDVLATLVSTASQPVPGTVGADMDTVAKRRGCILVATDTLRFDRITSAFTAGAGYAVVTGNLIQNDGA